MHHIADFGYKYKSININNQILIFHAFIVVLNYYDDDYDVDNDYNNNDIDYNNDDIDYNNVDNYDSNNALVLTNEKSCNQSILSSSNSSDIILSCFMIIS